MEEQTPIIACPASIPFKIKSEICIPQKKRKKRKRSEEAEKRRKQKKKDRTRAISTEIPYTNAQKKKKECYEILFINSPTVIHDIEGKDVFLQLFKNAIPTALLNNLELTLQQLVQQFPPKCKKNSRGDSSTYTLGCLRKCQATPYITLQTQNEHCRTFIRNNQELITLVNELFKNTFPKLYDHYNSINLPQRFFGVFASLTINVDFPVKPHVDEADFQNGYCWLLTCGNYEGGYLHLNDMRMNIDASPGNVIAFKSKVLKHQTSPYTGKRFSFVFYTHNNLFC